MAITFRTLRADEIDIRVGSVSQRGASLLLYKDARCDMAILDESVGPMNWQRHHSRDNANCIVSIWDAEKAQWIEKEDTGTESNTEKEKGLASDSFKRACVNFGIGRELYTSPFIFVQCDTVPKQGRGYELANKYQFSGCRVTDIGYDENRSVNRLVICDQNGNKLYSYGVKDQPKQESQDSDRKEKIDEILKIAKKKKITVEEICERASSGRPKPILAVDDMPDPLVDACLNWIKGEKGR